MSGPLRDDYHKNLRSRFAKMRVNEDSILAAFVAHFLFLEEERDTLLDEKRAVEATLQDVSGKLDTLDEEIQFARNGIKNRVSAP